MPRADDDAGVDDRLRREDVEEVEHELLAGVPDDHLVGVDPAEDLLGNLDGDRRILGHGGLLGSPADGGEGSPIIRRAAGPVAIGLARLRRVLAGSTVALFNEGSRHGQRHVLALRQQRRRSRTAADARPDGRPDRRAGLRLLLERMARDAGQVHQRVPSQPARSPPLRVPDGAGP